MSRSIKTTATGAASRCDEESSPLCLALVIVWSASEPWRVGEIAFFPIDKLLHVGRGGDGRRECVRFFRHRPGETPRFVDDEPELLKGSTISGVQLEVTASSAALAIKRVGKCKTYVNGVEAHGATLRPGDTVMFKQELVLLCVLRARTLPRPASLETLHEFGEPDAHGIVGESPEAWNVRIQIALAAKKNDHVLILGETGTGKELVARAIHRLSVRRKGPFISRNAAAIPATLMAAELFGNLPNYPNPGPGRKGFCGEADGGTGFLDEIGDLDLQGQVDLLRVLDDGEYTMLGEGKPRRADFRLIGATNRDDRRFRPDFHERFTVRFRLPPLRLRREDIPLIIRHILLARLRDDPKAAERLLSTLPSGRVEPKVSEWLVDSLVRDPPARNVRELRRILVKAIDEAEGRDEVRLPAPEPAPEAAPESLPPLQRNGQAAAERARVEDRSAAAELSKEQVEELLRAHAGNITVAAKAGNVSRSALIRRMIKFGLRKSGGE